MKLLSAENVNKEALLDYAREAADFSTNYQVRWNFQKIEEPHSNGFDLI